MSEFKLQSPPRQRVHLYVNTYTHDYEIIDILTIYEVQHIGYYVGSFFSYDHLAKKDVYHNIRYKIMDQTALDERKDGKRTNICFTCNKQDTGLKIAQTKKKKKKQTWSFVFVYVDLYSHELKILPTMRLAHQFQKMKYVGILKSFCNKYKINSPQITISVESQTENMQNDNTSVSDSEISQTAERLERLAESLNIPKSNQNASFFKKKKKKSVKQRKKIKSTVINRKICHPVRKKSKTAKRKKSMIAKTRQKKTCYKSKKHGDKICPDILEKNTREKKRECDGEPDIPKKKRKTLSKIL